MRYGFQLARSLDGPPPEESVVELKLDGEMALWDGPQSRMWNRRGNDIREQFPELSSLPSHMVLVGEVCIFDSQGISDFRLILKRGQNRAVNRLLAKANPARFMAFDVLEVNGRNIMALPLRERLEILRNNDDGSFKMPMSWPASEIDAARKWVWERNEEGLVVKPLDKPYVVTVGDKRLPHYLKWKAWQHRAFPVIRSGPTGAGDGFTAFVNNGGHEQEVAVQRHSDRKALVEGKATAMLVRFLEESPALRQPSCRGVYRDVESAKKAEAWVS